VGTRRSELSEEEQDIPQVPVSPREAHGVLPALGYAEHLLRQLPGLRQWPACDRDGGDLLLKSCGLMNCYKDRVIQLSLFCSLSPARGRGIYLTPEN
jgi:hypothetical protein